MRPEHLEAYQKLTKSLGSFSSWKKHALKCQKNAKVGEPVSDSEIEDAEGKLKTKFPLHLRDFYREINGVMMNSGAGTVLPLEKMVCLNLQMWKNEDAELYMPFDPLLLFGAAGNGDFWAFRILANRTIEHGDVFAWNHETDSRLWVAGSLRDFLVRIGSGYLYDAHS